MPTTVIPDRMKLFSPLELLFATEADRWSPCNFSVLLAEDGPREPDVKYRKSYTSLKENLQTCADNAFHLIRHRKMILRSDYRRHK